MNVVLFPLGNSAASEFYVPTFRNTLFCFIFIGCAYTTYEDGTECSETSAHKIQTSPYNPKKKEYKILVFRETVKLLLSVIHMLHVSA